MPRRKRPVLGQDYIIDRDGSAQFTREFLVKRGDCCENACRYCPYLQSRETVRVCPPNSDAPSLRQVHAS